MTNFENERQSAEHQGSISLNAPGLKPNHLRLAMHEKSYFLFAVVASLLAVAAIYATDLLEKNGFIILYAVAFCVSALIGLVAAFAWWLSVSSVNMNAIAIQKGLLTPAIPSSDGRSLVTMAQLSNDTGYSIYGVKTLDCKPLPHESRVVCASVFREGPGCVDRWHSYAAIPLRCGSNDTKGIAQCVERINREAWDALRRIATQNEMPGFQEMLLVDETFQVLETVSISLHQDAETHA